MINLFKKLMGCESVSGLCEIVFWTRVLNQTGTSGTPVIEKDHFFRRSIEICFFMYIVEETPCIIQG